MRLRSGIFSLFLTAGLLYVAGCASEKLSESQTDAALRERALRTLRGALATGEHWPKVHAAEFLLALDYPAGVREEFEKQLAARGAEPRVRVGIWRVLARAAYDPRKREEWTGKVLEAFTNPESPDRLHAVETLVHIHGMQKRLIVAGLIFLSDQ